MSHGIPDSQITIGSVQTHAHHERDVQGNETDKISSYDLTQTVQVSSADIDRIAGAARTITALIKDGVLLESEPPRYLYTKLADLKITMLAEATADATARAQQIATHSGARLGNILEAKMGVMQINAVHANDVSGSGVNDTTSRERKSPLS